MTERPEDSTFSAAGDDETVIESYAIVPEGSIVVATVTAVAYLGPNGSHGYAVRAHGDAPASQYLGLLVQAQREVLGWGQESNET